MKERQTGNLLPNVVISIVAGALSCIAILMLTHGPGLRERIPPSSATAASGLPDAATGSTSSSTVNANAGAIEDGAATAADMLQLQVALDAATEERAQLSSTLLTLNRQLTELERRVSDMDEQNDSSELAASDDISAHVQEMSSEDESGRAGFRPDPSERQFEGLLAAGLDEQTARDLQSRNDQFQLSRLELFDQAAREGWEDSDQLSESLEELEKSRPDLRAELGDSLYDQYLYEAGNFNRIAIDSVITGSAASQAGLQAGDFIISYAGERTFGVQDLQEATRSGSRGESVQLVFERDGQTLSTDMLRGPMGVTLRPSRQEP